MGNMTTRFAAEQLAKKLRLEAVVRPELNRFFRTISRTIRPVWVSTGQMPNLDPFQADLTALLRKHYARVQRSFRGDTTKSLMRSINEKQDEIPNVMLETEAALIVAANERAPIQATRILETTQDEFNTILADVAVSAAVAGEVLTRQQEATRITQDFNSRIPGRTNTIAMFETQAMAEETKLIEADTIAATGAVVAGIAIAQQMQKTWNTILDERTRDSHVLADLQNRQQGQPFMVQGQLLRVPGDTSLGASLGNVINCRCASEFTLGG
ncbi:MAG: hypothetical protein KAR39_13320 [Thermoplasmata archaeon]|nr:hypothetical protein [Thermoplasmata archaeon]